MNEHRLKDEGFLDAVRTHMAMDVEKSKCALLAMPDTNYKSWLHLGKVIRVLHERTNGCIKRMNRLRKQQHYVDALSFDSAYPPDYSDAAFKGWWTAWCRNEHIKITR